MTEFWEKNVFSHLGARLHDVAFEVSMDGNTVEEKVFSKDQGWPAKW